MYKKAIEKLQDEINQKQNLINNIENFDDLSLIDKFKTIKECSLRYERQEMSKILQQEFKSDILRNATSCHIGVNHFYIQHDIFVFKIGLYSGNIIEIESEEKIIDERKLQDSIVTREERLLFENLNSFINNPTLKGYKELSPNIKKRSYIEYFFKNKKLIRRLTEKRNKLQEYIEYKERKLFENEEKIEQNNDLREKCNQYLKDIEQDLNYFKEHNYNINLKIFNY